MMAAQDILLFYHGVELIDASKVGLGDRSGWAYVMSAALK